MGDNETLTTSTDSAGNYLFASLRATVAELTYRITVDTADPQFPASLTVNHVDPNGGGDSTALVALTAAVPINLAQDFGYYTPVAIGDLVFADLNNNGLFDGLDSGIDGVAVILDRDLNSDGDFTDPSEAGVATTTTAGGGLYAFTNRSPGTYQVRIQTPPTGYPLSSTTTVATDNRTDNDDNGIQTGGGTATVSPPIVLSAGDEPAVETDGSDTNTDSTIDFGFTPQACPDTWADWVDKWTAEPGMNGDTGPTLNPDGDRYDNLDEYAFCMPPNSGALKPFCLVSDEFTAAGAIDGVFRRTAGGTLDVIYTLEYKKKLVEGFLNDPDAVWQEIEIIFPPDGSANVTITNNGDGTEKVRISNLQGLPGLTDPVTGLTEGFVRIRVDLDADGNLTPEPTSWTDVQGWTETELVTSTTLNEVCCRTFNNPYLHCSTFTGTVDASDGVSGQTLNFVTSAGPVDLASLLVSGVAYYLEVTGGDNEGHRFDIDVVASKADGHSPSALIVQADTDLCAGTSPFNTRIVDPSPTPPATSLPASLAGDTVVLHRHRTLGELFPAVGYGFVASADVELADQVVTYTPGAVPSPWSTYSLYYNPPGDSTKRWVKLGEGTGDKGSSVIPPGQGMFFNRRGADPDYGDASIFAYGEVRENNFIRPLCKGNNLVGGGYPIDQSANASGGRAMNKAAGFFGSRDFKTADSFFVWKGDANPGINTYDTYYLLDGAPSHPLVVNWAKVGDASLSSRDAEVLLLSDRSVFIRVKNPLGLPSYTMPSPWTP